MMHMVDIKLKNKVIVIDTGVLKHCDQPPEMVIESLGVLPNNLRHSKESGNCVSG